MRGKLLVIAPQQQHQTLFDVAGRVVAALAVGDIACGALDAEVVAGGRHCGGGQGARQALLQLSQHSPVSRRCEGVLLLGHLSQERLEGEVSAVHTRWQVEVIGRPEHVAEERHGGDADPLDERRPGTRFPLGLLPLIHLFPQLVLDAVLEETLPLNQGGELGFLTDEDGRCRQLQVQGCIGAGPLRVCRPWPRQEAKFSVFRRDVLLNLFRDDVHGCVDALHALTHTVLRPQHPPIEHHSQQRTAIRLNVFVLAAPKRPAAQRVGHAENGPGVPHRRGDIDPAHSGQQVGQAEAFLDEHVAPLFVECGRRDGDCGAHGDFLLGWEDLERVLDLVQELVCLDVPDAHGDACGAEGLGFEAPCHTSGAAGGPQSVQFVLLGAEECDALHTLQADVVAHVNLLWIDSEDGSEAGHVAHTHEAGKVRLQRHRDGALQLGLLGAPLQLMLVVRAHPAANHKGPHHERASVVGELEPHLSPQAIQRGHLESHQRGKLLSNGLGRPHCRRQNLLGRACASIVRFP
mmetsp:Transcript_52119/g.130918  ORF Transcript_52119/g.130918 Transcript_52119/m.130918 type:complete len:519 (+) Transcript_52119:1964-3520(+)